METRVDKKAWSLCSSLYEGLKIRQMRTNPVYHRRRSDVFIINFEHTLRLVLVFLLLALSW